MQSKSQAIQYLNELIAVLESSDEDHPLLRRIRNGDFPYPFWDNGLHRRIDQIERNIIALMARPALSCRWAIQEGGNLDQLITIVTPGSQRVNVGYNFLQDRLKEAIQLTICDPYFLKTIGKASADKASAEEYVSWIDYVIPESVKTIELFVKRKTRDEEVAARFVALCKRREIKLICRKTDGFHDRVWIADTYAAFVVGASFNGLHNKPTYLVELERVDRQDMMHVVDLLRRGTKISKSI